MLQFENALELSFTITLTSYEFLTMYQLQTVSADRVQTQAEAYCRI